MTGQSFSSRLCMYLFWWHLESEWARGWFNSASAYEACVHCDILEVLGGGRGMAGMGHRQIMMMSSLLYYLSPWRPSALCAVCVRSPHRSCLWFWTAAESGVYSKIHLGELRSCQASVWCCSACSRSMVYGRPRCQQPLSPMDRPSSHMMNTLPLGAWSWKT